MRDILVHVRDFTSWSASVRYAAELAATLQASLTGIYVCPSPVYDVPPYSTPEVVSVIIENTRKLEEGAQGAKAPFAAWAHARGVPKTAWQIAEGYLPKVLAHVGNWHDLVVLEGSADMPWGSAAALGELVLGTGLPCVIVPDRIAARERPFDCIALAWNGSPEALRAIHSALPLLQRAQRIVLLRGEQRELLSDIGANPPFDILDYLARHEIRVEQKSIDTTESQAGDALIAATTAVRADLLVMGAYGRTRFSEWIFGGATRHVLKHCPLPLFMRH